MAAGGRGYGRRGRCCPSSSQRCIHIGSTSIRLQNDVTRNRTSNPYFPADLLPVAYQGPATHNRYFYVKDAIVKTLIFLSKAGDVTTFTPYAVLQTEVKSEDKSLTMPAPTRFRCAASISDRDSEI